MVCGMRCAIWDMPSTTCVCARRYAVWRMRHVVCHLRYAIQGLQHVGCHMQCAVWVVLHRPPPPPPRLLLLLLLRPPPPPRLLVLPLLLVLLLLLRSMTCSLRDRICSMRYAACSLPFAICSVWYSDDVAGGSRQPQLVYRWVLEKESDDFLTGIVLTVWGLCWYNFFMPICKVLIWSSLHLTDCNILRIFLEFFLPHSNLRIQCFVYENLPASKLRLYYGKGNSQSILSDNFPFNIY